MVSKENSLFETERREISISESKKNLIKNSFSAFACCWTTANAHTKKIIEIPSTLLRLTPRYDYTLYTLRSLSKDKKFSQIDCEEYKMLVCAYDCVVVEF